MIRQNSVVGPYYTMETETDLCERPAKLSTTHKRIIVGTFLAIVIGYQLIKAVVRNERA